MALLEILEILLMMLDGGLELLDVLGATLTEGRLCLTVTLFAFFRRGIYLARRDQSQPHRRWLVMIGRGATHWFTTSFSFGSRRRALACQVRSAV